MSHCCKQISMDLLLSMIAVLTSKNVAVYIVISCHVRKEDHCWIRQMDITPAESRQPVPSLLKMAVFSPYWFIVGDFYLFCVLDVK